MVYDDNDGFSMNSGKTLDANNGIVGINPRGDVYQGYDGALHPSDNLIAFTDAEKQEIARYMADLWLQWGGVEDYERSVPSG